MLNRCCLRPSFWKEYTIFGLGCTIWSSICFSVLVWVAANHMTIDILIKFELGDSQVYDIFNILNLED